MVAWFNKAHSSTHAKHHVLTTKSLNLATFKNCFVLCPDSWLLLAATYPRAPGVMHAEALTRSIKSSKSHAPHEDFRNGLGSSRSHNSIRFDSRTQRQKPQLHSSCSPQPEPTHPLKQVKQPRLYWGASHPEQSEAVEQSEVEN